MVIVSGAACQDIKMFLETRILSLVTTIFSFAQIQTLEGRQSFALALIFSGSKAVRQVLRQCSRHLQLL